MCIAQSLEAALNRLARPDVSTAVRMIQVCIEDLRERAPLLDAVPNDRAHMERRP